LRAPFLDCKNQPYPISAKVKSVNRELRDFAQRTEGIEYVDFNEYICPDGVCYGYEENGLALYYDAGHIDIEASWRIGHRIVESEGVPFPFSEIKGWID
jgi:hypothetical protein